MELMKTMEKANNPKQNFSLELKLYSQNTYIHLTISNSLEELFWHYSK